MLKFILTLVTATGVLVGLDILGFYSMSSRLVVLNQAWNYVLDLLVDPIIQLLTRWTGWPGELNDQAKTVGQFVSVFVLAPATAVYLSVFQKVEDYGEKTIKVISLGFMALLLYVITIFTVIWYGTSNDLQEAIRKIPQYVPFLYLAVFGNFIFDKNFPAFESFRSMASETAKSLIAAGALLAADLVLLSIGL